MNADAWKLELQGQAEARLLLQELKEMDMKTWMVLLFLLVGCVTTDNEATKALTKAGFTDVQPTGLDFFECGEDDKTGKGFKAKNAQGVQVEGVVCCGVLKGCTVRF